jgi:hypothetical protein
MIYYLDRIGGVSLVTIGNTITIYGNSILRNEL